MKYIFSTIFALVCVFSQAQNGNNIGSILEMRAVDSKNDVLLRSNHGIVTYNNNSGELKLSLNTATLQPEDAFSNYSMQIQEDILMPADSLMLHVSAFFSDGQLNTSHDQTTNFTSYQIPATVNYRGIPYSVIMTYSYGTSMTMTTSGLYLNLSFEFNPNPNYPLFIPRIQFYPTLAQFNILDAFANYTNF